MNRKRIARVMLASLYWGGEPEVRMVCEAIIASRNQIEEGRSRSIFFSAPPEEIAIAMNGGELAKEVLELFQREPSNLVIVEKVLWNYASQE